VMCAVELGLEAVAAMLCLSGSRGHGAKQEAFRSITFSPFSGMCVTEFMVIQGNIPFDHLQCLDAMYSANR
jgi:hypothetical protein